MAFSQSFVDVRERSKGQSSSRALMNLHNNEAGRKVSELHISECYMKNVIKAEKCSACECIQNYFDIDCCVLCVCNIRNTESEN